MYSPLIVLCHAARQKSVFVCCPEDSPCGISVRREENAGPSSGTFGDFSAIATCAGQNLSGGPDHRILNRTYAEVFQSYGPVVTSAFLHVFLVQRILYG